MSEAKNPQASGMEIAIIGMAGRFPGANNLEEFWRNLRDGVESISFFTDEELQAAGVPAALYRQPNYVRARGILSGVDLFDAGFFGFLPREAELLDPQHRLFLECAWETIEQAGYNPENYPGLIGVFGGVGMNAYLLSYVMTRGGALDPAEGYQLAIGNDKDFLATRVSYKLNLKGPSLAVQTACSTSLVAVVLACQSLLSYQCDMALAGGVTISLPQESGYLYQEGMILSPDGHCRAFDAKAQGTVPGNGVGTVLLKRLEEALADGDTIHAVIKGTALNNDGSLKVGYTAPSVDGQAEVIATALAVANVDPASIGYIETHGTGTPLGDPIEIAALTRVFREKTAAKHFCALGAVKSNVGHLDAAAGIAGLIKTVLALAHREIPPSRHFERPNPQIDFTNSPFFVNAELREWPSNGSPRRAGVSSFGIGGTNAHVILEEAPAVRRAAASRPWQLVLLSARSPQALETMTDQLARHLRAHPGLPLPDVAYTLQTGRKRFTHRRMLVAGSRDDALTILEQRDPKRLLGAAFAKEQSPPPIVFMFSGQGAQYVNMGLELYQQEAGFRDCLDFCADFLRPLLDVDLRRLLYPPAEKTEQAAAQLQQTFLTQSALFVIEYALAKLWQEWGVTPQAMIGHSIGEYVAACLAGVFTLEEALTLVASRGRLMQSLPGGAMLSVPLEENKLRPLLDGGLALAAVNAPANCVVSGTVAAIADLQAKLAEKGIECRRLHTSHAFHSEMMEAILPAFTAEVKKVKRQPPKLPFLSNLTGTWITAGEATDPAYWAQHLRHTVRFGDGVQELLQDSSRVFLEVGPGQTLSALVKRQPNTVGRVILSSLRHPQEQQSDMAFLLTTLGRLWLAGVPIDWTGFYKHEQRRRVPLPTYPFERQRYWLETGSARSAPAIAKDLQKKTNLAGWFYLPSWRRRDQAGATAMAAPQHWLLFADDSGLAAALTEELQQRRQTVTLVKIGRQFARRDDGSFTITPLLRADYERLLDELVARHQTPQVILHLWSIDGRDQAGDYRAAKERGFDSLLLLTQALAKHLPAAALQIGAVTAQAQEVTGEENLQPAQATLTGLCRVIPQEFPNFVCRSIDVIPVNGAWPAAICHSLLQEFAGDNPATVIAYRGGHRWVQSFEPLPLENATPPRLREHGVYLITGGLGRIGLTFAEYLAEAVRAKLVLVERSAFPEKAQWPAWLREPSRNGDTAKMQRLLALEGKGAEVLVVQADVANEAEMRQALTQAEARFGALHGVIHAAGKVGAATFRTLAELTPAEVEEQWRAKVEGTRVLQRLLSGRELDFVVLQSSLASQLGGLGFAAYAAANLYLDAFAQQQQRAGQRQWISVNWDGWDFGETAPTGLGSQAVELGITPAEGVAVFQRILATPGLAQIVVSTADLDARLERWISATRREQKPAAEGAAATRHARPNLPTAYVAPANELEQQIVELWEKLLGIAGIGRHDNFFELGGNSLLGTQLASQLRSTFQVELPLRRLFEDPTPAAVAAVIAEARKTGEEEVNKIAEMLALVEKLSPEEVAAMLGREKATP
ncbi:MAG: SDR family NAD(P)-dependent oxidoreductase [candidate division KSB1 bacterium]|nr:SDR family NAD(P)-dependent oxidoreductase [candidate division KSB1 bacterium]MDZ7273648.1 SDR family NAD(P)-dependent oxidoreductase [candidate division KSB1 bacterium]MDZ7286761.1 SDR family NAD(P)-dependent oxidoreductase [candidate division KSB1 bacterium]MDZ7299882.1 SDR family NAD(P)-dependent oxidoreductase [candidate division KSB1 bacterium]MDZ7305819.1 SDR family NAD(P)-dependent oxidoreductase [candidate division KSB1 bacterium]